MRRKKKFFKHILIWIFIFEILFINGANLYIFNGLANNTNTVMEYEVGDSINSVDISYDGKYIAVGSDDHYIYLFNNTGSTPLWKYDTLEEARTVSMSSNGQYITVGSYNGRVYLFHKSNSTPLW